MMSAIIILGPLPFLPIGPSLHFIWGSVAFAGIGYGGILVSTFSRAYKRSIALGYCDSVATYLVLTGYWNGSMHLGNFVGPTVSGFLVEYFGFASATLFTFVAFSVMLIIDIVQFISSVKTSKKSKSYEELK